MDDKDRVFARFKDDRGLDPQRRETVTVPRRAGGSGSRTVEVVHVRSGGTAKDKLQRIDPQLRAASWEGGFPAKQPTAARMPTDLIQADGSTPATHVMPAWGQRPVEVVPSNRPGASSAAAKPRLARSTMKSPQPARRVADPFDADDDGANCMRCGYAIEPTRQESGLMTCAACA